MRRLISMLLLPLSAVPLILAVPLIAAAHHNFERRHESEPLPAPAVRSVAPAALQAPRRDAVPVLAYEKPDRHAFAEQMDALDRLGFETISIDEYLRWRAERIALPRRRVLITFDGAWLDAYRSVDDVLRRHGFRAAMFVPTGALSRETDTRLSWRELHQMAECGRWDIEVQAHDGYVRVATGPDGATAPFYTVRRFTRSAGLESFAEYEERISLDLFTAKRELERQGFAPRAIALPFGDDGRRAPERRVRSLLSRLLDRQFEVSFASPVGRPARLSRRHGRPERFAVQPETSTGQLLDWLGR
jgi:polysaccharide deacetylase